MTNAKKSNIIYVAFLALLIPVLAVFIIFSNIASRKNFTLDYDIVFEIGSYNIKVTDCTYNTDEKTISFIFKYKIKDNTFEPDNSEPVVDSIISHYENSSDELAFSTESISEEETKVTCSDVPNKMWYITVNLYSKDKDYTDPDTVDEFGDIKKGEKHKGKEHRYYIQIDEKDMNKEAEETSSADDSSSSDSSKGDNSKTDTSYKSTTITTQSSIESTSKTSKSTAAATSKKTTESNISSTKNSTSTMAAGSTNAATNNVSKATAKPVQTTKATTRAAVKTTSKATTKATVKTTTVATVKAEALSLRTGYAANNVTLNIGQSAKVEAVLTPSSASSNNLVWSSNKPEIATVDSKGNIKAVSPGRAIIVVKTKNGNLSAACMVTVS